MTNEEVEQKFKNGGIKIVSVDSEKNEHVLTGDLSYNFISKQITVYTDEIKDIYQNLIFVDEELSFFKTIYYTQLILHELEHAKQEKIISEENGMESRIISLSIPNSSMINSELAPAEIAKDFLNSLKRMYVYTKNYIYVPHERMAEINSYQKIINIISLCELDLPNTKKYLDDALLRNFILGYDDTFSPTVKYFKELDNYRKNGLNDLDWYSENEDECLKKSIELYPFNQRIKWGLPIEKEKKLEMINKYKSIKSHQILKDEQQ